MPHPPPYGQIVSELLKNIFQALNLCFEKQIEKGSLIDRFDQDIVKLFNDIPYHTIHKQPGINNHLKFYRTHKNAPLESRISKIVIQSFLKSQEAAENVKAVLIPSPLNILYEILTVPEEPQSSAYALAVCRTILFKKFKVHPPHPNLQEGYEKISTSDIEDATYNFRSHNQKSDNIPHTPSKPAKMAIAHYLAMKGYFYLRLPIENKLDNEAILSTAKEYLSTHDLNFGGKEYEFRLSIDYNDIPDASVIDNELTGIPISIRGAETVFFGGLKSPTESGLVISINGSAGSGKTSLALSLLSNLSPFGTTGFYISTEEFGIDLKNRLDSITPHYLKKLSIYNSNVDDWFIANEFPPNNGKNSEVKKINRISDYLHGIKGLIDTSKKKKSEETKNNKLLPAICPLVVVIDSITGFLNFWTEDENKGSYYSSLEKFVDECRKLNAVVILLSGEDMPKKSSLDYLVDIDIKLSHLSTAEVTEKPVRTLQLTKTRHQISRPGSHIFHLSGHKGFRISPQIPSQLDKKENVKRHLANKDKVINTLNESDTYKSKKFDSFLDLYEGSQILLHGRGSAGKAGLALRILLTPPVMEETEISEIDFSDVNYKRKVLIISFLYPGEYYEELGDRINSHQTNIYEKLIDPEINVLYFYPGFLTPEDFLNKISRKIDEAILNGEPYTGVLIDGLHNVSLQFKKLQERDMIWPMLYNILVRYKLTVVSTFTNFEIDFDGVHGIDQEVFLQGHTPLLHVLVQATDFYLQLNPFEVGEKNEKKRKLYKLSVKAATNQRNITDERFWDRENLILTKKPHLNQQINLTF